MHNAGTQWGEVGTWVGGIGTWAVGVVAGFIAWRQYRQSKFRPVVKAFVDGDKRVIVQILNEAAGNGIVQDVNLLPPGHPEAAIRHYDWEINDHAEKNLRFVPFAMPGLSTAHLVLIPDNPALDGVRVRVDYGDGKDSGCVKIKATDGHVYGSTYIPGRQPL